MTILRNICIALMLCAPALAWNCTTPGQVRVQVPTGTTGSGTGDGSGQVVVDSGLTFICETLPVATTTPPSATNNNTSNSTSSSTATGGNSSSSSTSKGGNAIATGGQGGAGGSVSGSGNSSNTIAPVITATNTLSNRNTLSNSGNSSNTNNNTAKGGSANGNGSNNTTSQGQQQQQSNTSSNANNSAANATGNGSNSNNTVNNVEASKIPVNTAYAPTTFPTSPCLKSYSAGGQGTSFGFSLGGSKVDKNCALLETARSFDSVNERLAACKIKVSGEYAKKAGVTLADCMQIEMVPAPNVPVAVVPAPVAPQIIVMQTPVPAPVPAIATVPISNFQGFYTKLDNVAKAKLDGTTLLLKGNLDGHLRLRYNKSNVTLAQTMIAYLTSNGIDAERVEARDDGHEQGVEAIYIQ